MEQLTAAMSQQTMAHSAELQRREDHWANECQKLQRMSETAVIRLQRLEAEKEMGQHGRRDSDILRIKNQELEEKIRRLEHQSKARMLRDKTNTIQCPEMTMSSADATPFVAKTYAMNTSTSTTNSSYTSSTTGTNAGPSATPKPMASSLHVNMPPPAPHTSTSTSISVPHMSVYKPMPSTSARFSTSTSSHMNSNSTGTGGLHQPGCATVNHR